MKLPMIAPHARAKDELIMRTQKKEYISKMHEHSNICPKLLLTPVTSHFIWTFFFFVGVEISRNQSNNQKYFNRCTDCFEENCHFWRGGVKTEIRWKTHMGNHLNKPHMEVKGNQTTGKTSIDGWTTGGTEDRHFFYWCFGRLIRPQKRS